MMAPEYIKEIMDKPFSCDRFREYKNIYTQLIGEPPNCTCNCSGGAVYNKIKERLKRIEDEKRN